MTVLVKFEAARHALAEARSIDEVKQVRDQAEALRLYVKQQDMGLEMQNDIAIIKLRAERRAGELLREMERNVGGNPNMLQDVTGLPPTLSDLGISRFQSSRWQKEAGVPEEDFEQYVAKTKAKKEEITSTGLQKLADKIKKEEKRQKYTAAGEDIMLATETYQLICGDFAEVGLQLADESVDVIITDPPYPKEYLHLYGLLAREAARLLKPGGSLLAMAGQSYLPKVLRMLEQYLAYHWTIAYETPGGQAAMIHHRNVNTFWKPVFWFVKGKYEGDWRGDVVVSNVNENDKRFHDWGQSESGIGKLVADYTLPGNLVLDPFVGGGTTAVACVRLGRRFIGIDIEQEQIDITLGRLKEENAKVSENLF